MVTNITDSIAATWETFLIGRTGPSSNIARLLHVNALFFRENHANKDAASLCSVV